MVKLLTETENPGVRARFEMEGRAGLRLQHPNIVRTYKYARTDGIDYLALKKSFERLYIEEALRLAGGNESKAARLLGMNHHTFRYQKKKLDED